MNQPNPKTQKRKSDKERLDQLLVTRGLADTRAQAQALILAGRVRVEGQVVAKAGTLVPETAPVEVAAPSLPLRQPGRGKAGRGPGPFRSEPRRPRLPGRRGQHRGLQPGPAVGGAPEVYAVDVGYGQLAPVVRNDPRVVVLERVNLRLLPREAVPEPVDLATLDLSFISLTLVLPKILEFLRPGGAILALVKPQFEVGKGKVGKGGVVRDPSLQQEAVDRVAAAAALWASGERRLSLALEGPQGQPGVVSAHGGASDFPSTSGTY